MELSDFISLLKVEIPRYFFRFSKKVGTVGGTNCTTFLVSKSVHRVGGTKCTALFKYKSTIPDAMYDT